MIISLTADLGGVIRGHHLLDVAEAQAVVTAGVEVTGYLLPPHPHTWAVSCQSLYRLGRIIRIGIEFLRRTTFTNLQ